MYQNKTAMLRIFWWWWENPARAAGMYTTEHGRVKIIDKTYQFPPDYPFVLDGLRRSPYVDAVLREYGTDFQTGLEELFGVEEDSGRKLFRNSTLDMVRTTVRPPVREGHIEKNGNGEYVFRDEPNGPVKVWGRDVGGGKGGPYACGSDLAAGRQQGYSTVEAIDLETGEQVLDFATKEMPIVEFTQYAHGIYRWLAGGCGQGHVFVTFENNADLGNTFGEEITRLGWNNVERNRRKIPDRKKAPEYLGQRNKDGGFSIMMEMERAIRDAELTPRSDALLDEMGLFDKEEKNGKWKPAYPFRADGHGDRTQGFAMAWDMARGKRSGVNMESVQASIVNADVAAKKKAYFEALNGTHKKRSWSAGWRLT
jgi:hypothetical protein